jgi:hypothetical protein
MRIVQTMVEASAGVQGSKSIGSQALYAPVNGPFV